jgi:hypothetical protein
VSYLLRMSGEIHDWLADLHETDPPAAVQVGQALSALMSEGASLGPPLVVPAAVSWPKDLLAALERAEPGTTDVRTLASYVEALGGRLEIIAEFAGDRVLLR